MTKIRTSNGCIVVTPEVNVVASSAETVRKELLALINQDTNELVVDLSKVRRVDSMGIGVFIATYHALKKKEKKLVVVNASPKIKSLFQTMGLLRRFSVSGATPD